MISVDADTRYTLQHSQFAAPAPQPVYNRRAEQSSTLAHPPIGHWPGLADEARRCLFNSNDDAYKQHQPSTGHTNYADYGSCGDKGGGLKRAAEGNQSRLFMFDRRLIYWRQLLIAAATDGVNEVRVWHLAREQPVLYAHTYANSLLINYRLYFFTFLPKGIGCQVLFSRGHFIKSELF